MQEFAKELLDLIFYGYWCSEKEEKSCDDVLYDFYLNTILVFKYRMISVLITRSNSKRIALILLKAKE